MYLADFVQILSAHLATYLTGSERLILCETLLHVEEQPPLLAAIKFKFPLFLFNLL